MSASRTKSLGGDAGGEDNDVLRRFRGSWIPAIRDPVGFFNYSSPQPTATKDARTAALTVERVAESIEQHDNHGLEEEPPKEFLASASGEVKREDLPFPVLVAGVIADELVRDMELAKVRVRTLQSKYPQLDQDSLCRLLIHAKCKQGAIVGICAAGPAMMLPGWGSLASILLGGVADVTLTTKLEIDLALEISALYEYHLNESNRRSYLLKVSGLEGLDHEQVGSDDEKVTREAGERLAVRTTEEVGKRSLLKLVPVIGATTAAGTNVVGIYVIGRRAQLICKNQSHRLGSWRESVNEFVVPAEVTKAMAVQISRIPSRVTIQLAEATTRIGYSARSFVSRTYYY